MSSSAVSTPVDLIDLVVRPYDWMADALCAQVDPDLFFPDYQGDKSCNTAKTVCAKCPVVAQCLEQALRVPAMDDFGVWGNTTPPEREEIRRQRRAAQPGIDLTTREFEPLDQDDLLDLIPAQVHEDLPW